MPKHVTLGISVSASIILTCVFLVSIRQLLPWGLAGFPLSKHPASETYKAPRENIWADLDDSEFQDILDYLYNVPNDLNLTRTGNATPWDNHIAFMEVLVPNKTDVLRYLDSEAAVPARYARVVINQGATEQAGILEYSVGPLPTSQETKIEPLIWPYNSGRNRVKNPLPQYEEIVNWFANLGHEVSDIVKDLLGEVNRFIVLESSFCSHVDQITTPSELEDIPPYMALSRPSSWNENGTVSSWAAVYGTGNRFDAWSLLAQSLYCHFEITGRDSSNWKINQWFYNGVLYNSTETFRTAWKKGEIKKLPANQDGSWTAAEPNLRGLPAREKPAPVMIQPEGARWVVDEKEKHVSWMGFEFYVNALQVTAMSLWDIKFRGERVIYELGLQEAMAHYAGNDPMSAGMLWLDSIFGIGFGMYELVAGYDCPAYATFLPATFRQGENTITRKNSICIFEYTADHPIQRHSTLMHVTVSRNTYLVVRSVSTLGNYDYTFDYIFYLDGTIEVKVRASGYIFAAYHQLEAMREDLTVQKREMTQYDYGYQVHDLVATSMHDHTINFKADLDIAGTLNTLYRIDITPWTHHYNWDADSRNTMRLVHHPIATETALDWPKNAGAMYVVVNNESTNAWNEKRGYRITPGTGMATPPHLTIQHSNALGKAGNWAYHDLFVLRQHDNERKSGSEYNVMEPLDPLIDFDAYLNGEGTVQEDLVVYFNLGTHHVPHSGDVPNTLMHTSGSSVMFVPHNWADRDLSRDSAQGVKITMEKGKKSKVDKFGGVYEKDVEIKKEMLTPDLSNYTVPDKGTMGFLSWNETLAAL
jgi:primary-amine oxidase